MSKNTKPYLSIIAASRNDNHGEDMLKRMRMFINGLIEQCNKYQLRTELIIVEWNPPAETEPLSEGENDIAVLLFTSGTTGDPKAAVLRHCIGQADGDKARFGGEVRHNRRLHPRS